VLDAVGGFSPEFLRQAEEYDLSFRILRRGHRIERFEDVVFRHEKVPGGRSSALVHRMDLRNNLILVERFLPKPLRRQYRHDWVRRYTALAGQDGEQAAAKKGLYEAMVWARRERAVGRQTLDEQTIELIFSLRARAEQVARWKDRHNVRRVAIADFGKNVYATYAACGLASLERVILLDHREAFKGLSYRGLPISDYSAIPQLSCDGVIVSNTNPAQVASLADRVRAACNLPVLTFWHPRYMNEPLQPDTTDKPSAPSARAA